MDFFKKKEEKKTKTQEIEQERDSIKLNLAAKLYQIGFDESEVEQVLSVIQTAEEDINKIKKSLIGTNINPKGDPMEPLTEGVKKIKERQLLMQKEINELIENIKNKHQGN